MTTEAITPLRQRMIEDMNSRKLCAHTQRGHIHSCKRLYQPSWKLTHVRYRRTRPDKRQLVEPTYIFVIDTGARPTPDESGFVKSGISCVSQALTGDRH